MVYWTGVEHNANGSHPGLDFSVALWRPLKGVLCPSEGTVSLFVPSLFIP